MVFLTEFGLCMRLAPPPSEAPVSPPPPPPPQLKTYVPLAGHNLLYEPKKQISAHFAFVESKTGSKESEDRTVNPEAFSDVDLVLPIFS